LSLLYLLYRFHFNLAKFYFRLNLKIFFHWISHKDWYDEKVFYGVKFLKAPLFTSIYYLVSSFFWLFFFRLVDLFSPCDFWFLLYDFLHDGRMILLFLMAKHLSEFLSSICPYQTNSPIYYSSFGAILQI
jgi:hypothetical protein